MVAVSSWLAAGRERRRRLLRTAVLGGALLTSVLLTLHLSLPDDNGLRGTLLLPFERSAVAAAPNVDVWSQVDSQVGHGQAGVDPSSWLLPNLTGPDLRRTYRVLQPTAQPDYGAPEAGVVPAGILPDSCLERWLGRGQACEPDEVTDKAGDLDIVWTWVNGESCLE